MRILRFSALNILKILSNLKALNALRLPLSPFFREISIKLITTIRESNILNRSLIKVFGPIPITFIITSTVKVAVNI